jgi:xanthine dehydrogenase YagS FAD-binding subunit
MKPFTYTQVHSPEDAIAQVAQATGAKFLAGGTNFMDLWKEGVETPDRLIDIRKLSATKITLDNDGGVRIGATITNSAAAYHPWIQQQYPVLSQAILAGASAQLRNMATIGGNLLQRNRCSYFHDISYPCNKRQPGSGCPAIEGIHRMHAIFGTSQHCIAANPSDMCVALAALGATIQTRKANGEERSIPFEDFHRLPGETPHIETVLEPGELILSVTLPALPYAVRSHYLKVRDRTSYAFALVSAAVVLDFDHDIIQQAHIAMGGVGTKPWRFSAAESSLIGHPPTLERFQAAAAIALEGAQPRPCNAFKVELAQSTLVQSLLNTAQMEIKS